jgi:SPX domain protein involved in polyphosphate accumulation
MKFGKYLQDKARPEWRQAYVDYKGLKDLIKEAAADAATTGETSFSPRTTSLTVQRVNNKKDSASERFFKQLEAEVCASLPAAASRSPPLVTWKHTAQHGAHIFARAGEENQ